MGYLRRHTISDDTKAVSVKIEEIIWAGQPTVYVNNFLTHETFEEACERIGNAAARGKEALEWEARK